MGLFVPTSRRVKNRRFSYEPRFYNPEKDESLKRRMRLKGMSKSRRRSPMGIVIFAILLAMAIYAYIKLA